MNRSVILAVFLILLVSCKTENKEVESAVIPEPPFLEVPSVAVSVDALAFDRNESVWKSDTKPFSGFAIQKYANGSLRKKFGLLNGKMQNSAIEWYPDGVIKDSANYYEGKLHGLKKSWTQDSSHILVAQLNYYLGKGHGKQRKWYPTGELYQQLNLHLGAEQGLQKAYRKNGVLYANYEAKNGRIFGMKKAKLCFQLESQEIKGNED